MATFKAEVYAHQKRADGTYNIKIRVTHKTRKKYLATPWYVGKEDLTRGLKLKNQRYIDMVDELVKRYRRICNNVGEGLDSMTVEQVVELVTRDEGGKPFDLDIVAYTREHINRLIENGRPGNAASYRISLNSLIAFAGRESISIRELTVKFINDWMAWIVEHPRHGNHKDSRQAVRMYASSIRAMYNRAKREFNDEEAGVIRIPFSPFNRVEIPRPPLTRKRALTVDELKRLVAVPYRRNTYCPEWRNDRFNLAKDVFMLSFLLMGMNAVDLYNATDYSNGRITYQRTKTKNRRADRAEMSVKVEPEAIPLVEKYRDPKGERVFRFHRQYATHRVFNVMLNTGLKLVGDVIGVEDLEFYAARHSWATIAVNDVGIDKYTVHAALNHVDPAMKVTDIYIRKSWDPIDAANRKVLDLLNLDLPSVDEPNPKGL